MKHYRNVTTMILFVLALGLVLSGCNFPKIIHRETPVPTVEPTPTVEDNMPMIQNPGTTSGETTTEGDGEMMIQNNSGGSTGGSGESDGDELMISNPGRSAIDFPKTASLGFLSTSNIIGTNAQIVKPTQTSDENLVIVNDHTVTYQESPSVIQKSVPSGALTPLSYIPPQSLVNGQSIAFAAGATSAVVSGYVPAGGYLSYNFYAFANQNFLVLLSSDSGTSVLSVSDVYGNVYLDPNQHQTSYSMYLPRTATYYINIHSTGYAENVTIQVFIPARVTIPQGQFSTSMSGTLSPYSVVSYTAYMYAGQTARIDDYSGAQPTSFLRVSGLQTGMVYMDYTAYSPSWYSVVPTTQDYLIEVISMDVPSYYRLTVDVR